MVETKNKKKQEKNKNHIKEEKKKKKRENKMERRTTSTLNAGRVFRIDKREFDKRLRLVEESLKPFIDQVVTPNPDFSARITKGKSHSKLKKKA